LKQKLAENKEANDRFVLNTQLIDISKMPEELSKRIELMLNEVMSEDKQKDVDEFASDDYLESLFGDPVIL
jgi:hypothetical protein